MERGSSDSFQEPFLLKRILCWFKALREKLVAKVVEFARNTKKIGQEDPRRVIHSLKVGLSLTLISLFYYFQPFYKSFGISAMWAVMTVVVVFEFSVGATLSKGLNRGLATLLAGALGVGAHQLANTSGKIGEPIIIGLFVFLLAATSTFVRFFPKVKARYDYGLLIFILTFSLVSVSGLREDEILEMANKRLSTVLIGASACVVVSIFVHPVWAGEDLHNLLSLNIDKLANFLLGFGEEYFNTSEREAQDDKSFLQAYKSVLNSKNTEETLANFARWEPGHGQFMYRHPWRQYLEIGTLVRQCAYRIEALNGYLNPKIQERPETQEKIKEICTKMSLESGKALKELSLAIKTMTHPSSPNSHVANSKAAAKSLQSLLKSGFCEDNGNFVVDVIPIAAVASLLSDVVMCTEKIADSVHELSSLAQFTKSPVNRCGSSELVTTKTDCHPHVVIVVNETTAAAPNASELLKSKSMRY